jgi:hypothetical protein
MFWVGSLAVFCFRIWLSSADCSSHLKSTLVRLFLAEIAGEKLE